MPNSKYQRFSLQLEFVAVFSSLFRSLKSCVTFAIVHIHVSSWWYYPVFAQYYYSYTILHEYNVWIGENWQKRSRFQLGFLRNNSPSFLFHVLIQRVHMIRSFSSVDTWYIRVPIEAIYKLRPSLSQMPCVKSGEPWTDFYRQKLDQFWNKYFLHATQRVRNHFQ